MFSINVFSLENQEKDKLSKNDSIVKEVKKEEPEKQSWERLFSLGFNMSSGNTDNSMWNMSLKTKKETERNIKSIEISGNYGESDDEKTSEKLEASFEDKYLLGEEKRWFLSPGVQFFHDDIAEIDYRVSLNPAIGYFWIKKEKISFNTEVGPSYVFEKVGKEDDNYLAPRVAERLELKLTDSASFYQFSEANISVKDSDDYKVNSEVGLDLAINSKLSVTLTVKDKYNNMPASDAKENDVEYITALTSRF